MSTTLEDKLQLVEEGSKDLEQVVIQICESCIKPLDDYISNISASLLKTPVSDLELDSFILGIPMYIYYANTQIESIGLREDLSALKKKEAIQRAIDNSQASTSAKRAAEAELSTITESLVNTIYQTAYKSCKSKIDTAYEILASCKKVASRRIEELKVANSDTGRIKG